MLLALSNIIMRVQSICFILHWLSKTVSVRIGPNFISEDLVVDGSYSQFDGFIVGTEMTLSFWIKPFSASPSSFLMVWSSVVDPSPSVTIYRSVSGFSGCYLTECNSIEPSGSLFTWTFLGFALQSTRSSLCLIDWQSSAPAECGTDEFFMQTIQILQSDFKLSLDTSEVMPTQVQFFSFEIFNIYDTDVQAKASTFSCHPVCISCYGPASNACDEFISLVDLEQVLELSTTPLKLTGNSPVFNGRSYNSVTNFGFSLWFRVLQGLYGFESLLRFAYTHDDCDQLLKYGYPMLYCYDCTMNYIDIELYYAIQYCSTYNWYDIFDSYDGYTFPVSPMLESNNGWVFYGHKINYSSRFAVSFLSKFKAQDYSDSITFTDYPTTWTLEPDSTVLFKESSSSIVQFKDVRIYFNADAASLDLVGIWDDMSTQCLSYCVICSSVEFCSECLDGFYVSNGLCLPCSGLCKTCTGPSKLECVDCMYGGLLGDCSPDCPLTSFVEIDGVCTPCNIECESCSSPAQCIVCRQGYYKLQLATLQCLEACPDGYYSEVLECQPCDISCKLCTQSTNRDCKECALSYISIQGKCVACPVGQGYLLTKSNECLVCSPVCDIKNCPLSEFNDWYCSSCFPMSILNIAEVEDSSECICKEGYLDVDPTTALTCNRCDSSCRTCFGTTPLECIACADRLAEFLQGIGCVCKAGYFVSASQVCEECAQPCKTCANYSTCLSCTDPEARLIQGECIKCPMGNYWSISEECMPCPEWCLSCTIQSCLQCEPDRELVDGLCECKNDLLSEDGLCKLKVNLTALDASSLRLEFASEPAQPIFQIDLAFNSTLELDWKLTQTDLPTIYSIIVNNESQNEVEVNLALATQLFDTLGRPFSQASHTVTLNFTRQSLTTPLTTTVQVTIGAQISTTATAFLYTSDITSFISLVSTIQLISFFPLINIPVSPMFRQYLIGVSVTEPLLDYLRKFYSVSEYPTFTRAEYADIDTSLYLFNISPFLIACIVAAVKLTVCVIIHACIRDSGFKKLLKRVILSYRWNVVLGICICSFIDLIVYCLIQIYDRYCCTMLGILSTILSGISGGGFLLVLIWLFKLAVVYPPKSKANISILFDDFKESRMAQLYYFCLVVFRLGVCCALVLLSSALQQLLVITVSTLLVTYTQMLTYLIAVKPFRSRLHSALSYVEEGSLLYIICLYYAHFFDLLTDSTLLIGLQVALYSKLTLAMGISGFRVYQVIRRRFCVRRRKIGL